MDADAADHNPEVRRGIGVADLVCSSVCDQPYRASGELAYHVLDLMQGFIAEALQVEAVNP